MKKSVVIAQSSPTIMNTKFKLQCDFYIVEFQLNKDTVLTAYQHSKDENRTGHEVYIGENYVVGSKKRLYSKIYQLSTKPKTKYDEMFAKMLNILHAKIKVYKQNPLQMK